MLITHNLNLNIHLIGLRLSPGFMPVGRLHLSLLSRSKEKDITDLLSFIGSNQLEWFGMKYTSETTPCLPRSLPAARNTPRSWGC